MKFKPNWGWASLPALLMVWVIVASHYPSYVLPQPWDVWREAIRWFSDGSIWGQLQASLLEEFTGFMTAVLLALILGVSAGLSDRVREFLTPLNSLFMAIPPIAWAPLMLLIFGLGFVSIVVVIVIAALFPMCLAIQEGIRGIRGGEVRAARTLGARPFQLLLHVYLPSSLPFITAALRISSARRGVRWWQRKCSVPLRALAGWLPWADRRVTAVRYYWEFALSGLSPG